MFESKIEPNDIKQGILGDCYFLSSCASIAENPERIKEIFISQNISPEGAYCVRIFERGERKEIIIDDIFPVDRKNEPVFTNGNGAELWVLILEKAWAKNYGNYAQIEAGLTREAMHDLTGAPCITLFVEDDRDHTVFKVIEQAE